VQADFGTSECANTASELIEVRVSKGTFKAKPSAGILNLLGFKLVCIAANLLQEADLSLSAEKVVGKCDKRGTVFGFHDGAFGRVPANAIGLRLCGVTGRGDDYSSSAL